MTSIKILRRAALVVASLTFLFFLATGRWTLLAFLFFALIVWVAADDYEGYDDDDNS